MAQQTLNTVVTISGRVDNSFVRIGNDIIAMGSMVNNLSRSIINIGKESIRVFGDYEQNMLDAKGALSAQYRDAVELNRVMKALHKSAQHWQKTTRFNSQEVSMAISDASHAGWKYEQQILGLPAAMKIARAGNMDLARSTDFVIKGINATETEFENIEQYIDRWAKAANLGATNIDEMGEAVLRMGATASFAKNTGELFTLLTILANRGTIGTNAGTLLRNSMIRLIAPVTKASDAMEALNMSGEELEEVIGGDMESLQRANSLLRETGFSVYDSEGKLKGFLEIYKELYAAVENMSEQEKNAIIGAIFPTRTITGALAFLKSAKDDYNGLYEDIMNSQGYATKVAEIQMTGLNDKIKIAESQFEELKRKMGELLKDDVTGAAKYLGDIAVSLTNIDDDKLKVLLKGMEGLAIAGPGMLILGGAMRIIGHLITPVGAIGMGVAGVLALSAAIQEMSKANIARNFGAMSVDMEGIVEHLNGIGSSFQKQYAEVNKFREGAAQAMKDFETASEGMASKLFSLFTKGTKLSDEDAESLKKPGEQMQAALIEGAANAQASSISFLEQVFGADTENKTFKNLMSIGISGFDGAVEIAEKLSKKMQDALFGLEGGKMTPEKYQEILAIIREYQDAIAEASAEIENENQYVALKMKLDGLNLASFEDLEEIRKITSAAREAQMTESDKLFKTNYYKFERRLKKDVSEGRISQTVMDRDLAELESKHKISQNKMLEQYDDLAINSWLSALKGSDGLKDVFGEVERLSKEMMAGKINKDQANKAMGRFGGNWLAGDGGWDNRSSKRFLVGDALARIISGLGGHDLILERIKAYEKAGDKAGADRLAAILTQEGIANNFNRTFIPEKTFLGIGAGGVRFYDSFSDEHNEMLMNLNMKVDQNKLKTERDKIQQTLDGRPYNIRVAPTVLPMAAPNNLYPGGTLPGGNMLMHAYAEGGRTDRPAIFGEGRSAEWAIPEERTSRTAKLLDAARQASGLTWGEIASHTLGGGSAQGGQGTQIVYSPTIYAENASGVESVLLKDKSRLEALLRDKKRRDGVERIS